MIASNSLEKREGALQKNLVIVTKDKAKIETTIENLDQHKRDALQKTWEKVNGYNFDSLPDKSVDHILV